MSKFDGYVDDNNSADCSESTCATNIACPVLADWLAWGEGNFEFVTRRRETSSKMPKK